MTSLSVYLGKSQPNGDVFKTICAATLAEAKLACIGSKENNSLESLEFIVKSSELASVWSPMDLAPFASLLKVDAKVLVRVMETNGEEDLKAIHSAFLLAGLTASGERSEANLRVFTALRKPLVNHTAAVNTTRNVVKLDLGDDDDLIDEDNLLSDSVLAPPPAMSAAATKDDCSGRKPCDDCTCGRAEKKEGEPVPVQKSSCGKCHLGDAFRCASCPYLGKPAFKPGEEHLVLNLEDDL